jgi:hypothetical protein
MSRLRDRRVIGKNSKVYPSVGLVAHVTYTNGLVRTKTNRSEFAVLLVFGLGISAASALAACGPDDTSDQVVDTLHESVNLNEEFKSAIADPAERKDTTLREQVELDTSTTLLPCMRRAAEILGAKEEPRLASALLETVISFSNSTNEEIPNTMGMIFGRNPDVIERSIRKLSSPERKQAVDLLLFGWSNVQGEFKAGVVKDRQVRLQQLSVGP